MNQNSILHNTTCILTALIQALIKKDVITNEEVDSTLQDLRNIGSKGSSLGSKEVGTDEADVGDASDLSDSTFNSADETIVRPGSANPGPRVNSIGSRQDGP